MRPDTTNPSRVDATPVRIEWPMNEHGAMTVRVEGTNEVRQLVEFENETLAEALARLPRGAVVPLTMRSLRCRGNAWRVTGLVAAENAHDVESPRREDATDRRNPADRGRGRRHERVEV